MRVRVREEKIEAEQFTGDNHEFIVAWLEGLGEHGHYDDGLEYVMPGHPPFDVPTPYIKLGEYCGGESAEPGDWIIVYPDRSREGYGRSEAVADEWFHRNFEVVE